MPRPTPRDPDTARAAATDSLRPCSVLRPFPWHGLSSVHLPRPGGRLRALGEGKAEATTGDRSTRARPLLPGGGTPAPSQTPMEPGVPVRTRGPPGLTREPRKRVNPAPSPGRPLEGGPQERTSPAREAPCRPVWGRHRVTFHVGSHGGWCWCPRVPSTESGRRRAHTAWRRRRVGREAGSLRRLIPSDHRQTTLPG